MDQVENRKAVAAVRAALELLERHEVPAWKAVWLALDAARRLGEIANIMACVAPVEKEGDRTAALEALYQAQRIEWGAISSKAHINNQLCIHGQRPEPEKRIGGGQ